jgi:antitoxin VapB
MVDFYLLEVEMGLNIKKPSTEAAIRALAAHTGQSLTDAVEQAVLEKLSSIQAAQEPDTLEKMLARLRPLQDVLKGQQIDRDDRRTARELINALYDEDGLPR